MVAMASEIYELTNKDVEGELMCFEALFPKNDYILGELDPILAYKASSDPDTMYLH